MAPTLDFAAIVDRAAQVVETQDRVTVTPEARAVLVDRASEHSADVAREVAAHNLSEADLVKAATAQLREATPTRRIRVPTHDPRILGFSSTIDPLPLTPLPPEIDAAAVHAGMARKCWFVPWC